MIDTGHAAARKPRTACRFSILLPVIRPPDMLPYAIRSVLAQTDPDFELCVICDGAPPETVEVARGFAAMDPRVHVFAFAKGLRHGEAHRAAVLEGAQAQFVAHLGDDDLWLPDHLETLAGLLDTADFVSVPAFTINPDRLLHPGGYGDLGLPFYRNRLLRKRRNFFGPTEAGYRLSAYRQLPEGWAPGPDDVWSDLHMWRKFLRHPGLRFHSGQGISTLKFATPTWQHLSLADRAAANAALWERLQDPATLAYLRREAPLLLARSVRWRHMVQLVFLAPGRYLPLLWLRLAGPRPERHPLD